MADKSAQRVSLKERLAEMQVRAAGGNMEKVAAKVKGTQVVKYDKNQFIKISFK